MLARKLTVRPPGEYCSDADVFISIVYDSELTLTVVTSFVNMAQSQVSSGQEAS